MAGMRRTTVIVIPLEGTKEKIYGVFIITTVGVADMTTEKLFLAVNPH